MPQGTGGVSVARCPALAPVGLGTVAKRFPEFITVSAGDVCLLHQENGEVLLGCNHAGVKGSLGRLSSIVCLPSVVEVFCQLGESRTMSRHVAACQLQTCVAGRITHLVPAKVLK